MVILQLPILALQERVEQELNENPMLEIEEVDPNLPDEEREESPPSSTTEDERELVVQDNQSNAEDFERLANMDNDMPETFDDFRRSSNRMQEDMDRAHDLMANAESRPESLNDYLLHQLAECEIDSDLEQLCERIISCLDARDGGYFKMPLSRHLASRSRTRGSCQSRTGIADCAEPRSSRHRRSQPDGVPAPSASPDPPTL